MQVLDASVVYKWYQQEQYTEKALEIREKYLSGELKISVPDFLLLELANIIRYKTNSHVSDIKMVLNNFIKLGIDIITPTIEIIEKAGELSFKYNISVYDAIYLALSVEMQYVFVTADKKLYEKVSKLSNVMLLKDLK